MQLWDNLSFYSAPYVVPPFSFLFFSPRLSTNENLDHGIIYRIEKTKRKKLGRTDRPTTDRLFSFSLFSLFFSFSIFHFSFLLLEHSQFFSGTLYLVTDRWDRSREIRDQEIRRFHRKCFSRRISSSFYRMLEVPMCLCLFLWWRGKAQ